jgi:hypothetical protein
VSWPEARSVSQVGLTIDMSQHKNKNGYYYNFKIQLGSWHEAMSQSQSKLIIDSSQYKDKNGYQHSF